MVDEDVVDQVLGVMDAEQLRKAAKLMLRRLLESDQQIRPPDPPTASAPVARESTICHECATKFRTVRGRRLHEARIHGTGPSVADFVPIE